MRLRWGFESTKCWLHFNEGGKIFTFSFMYGWFKSVDFNAPSYRLIRVWFHPWPIPFCFQFGWTQGRPLLGVRRMAWWIY